MADQGVAPDEQQLKQRAMRRLAVALTLIALAIAGLALLDRYHASQKKPEIPAAPPEQPALPGEPGARPPATEPPSAQQVPPPGTPDRTPPASPPSQVQRPAPPPPPVVSNEPLPRAESNRPAPKAGSEIPEDTTPVTKTAPSPAAVPEKGAPTPSKSAPPKEQAAPATAKPTEPPPVKGFVVQVGVFVTPDHARALQAKLAEKGIPSSIETRVVVGPFKDRAEADAVTKQLKDLGLQGMVIAPH